MLAGVVLSGLCVNAACAQTAVLRGPAETVESVTMSALPDAPAPVATFDATGAQNQAATSRPAATDDDPYAEGKQSKRILFIIPNFRAVSVDAKLPPLGKTEKLKLAVSDSFDYSSFIYVGLLAGAQMAENGTPEFHQGAAGYGRYYWHAFADNTDGNLMTEAVYPILSKEDPRYYTLGRGGFIKRVGYSLGRLIITRTDQGKPTFNVSEIAGNATSAAISNLYYPAQERTVSKTLENWGLQVGLDGASNLLKEFWPDVAHAMFHQKVEVETTPSKP